MVNYFLHHYFFPRCVFAANFLLNSKSVMFLWTFWVNWICLMNLFSLQLYCSPPEQQWGTLKQSHIILLSHEIISTSFSQFFGILQMSHMWFFAVLPVGLKQDLDHFGCLPSTFYFTPLPFCFKISALATSLVSFPSQTHTGEQV